MTDIVAMNDFIRLILTKATNGRRGSLSGTWFAVTWGHAREQPPCYFEVLSPRDVWPAMRDECSMGWKFMLRRNIALISTSFRLVQSHSCYGSGEKPQAVDIILGICRNTVVTSPLPWPWSSVKPNQRGMFYTSYCCCRPVYHICPLSEVRTVPCTQHHDSHVLVPRSTDIKDI